MIPLQISCVAIFRLSAFSKDTLIHDTVGLLAFVASCIDLTVFGAKIVPFIGAVRDDGIVTKERKEFRKNLLMWIVVGTPVSLAILALVGYFRTAYELEEKLFITGALTMFTLITLKAIFEALTLIDDAQKTPIDETALQSATPLMGPLALLKPTIARQQSQSESTQVRSLVRIMAIFGFAVGCWFIWSSFVPALGILDDISLFTQQIGTGDNLVIKTITLQDISLAVLVMFLTVVSAKNLPGFLELLILRRTKLDTGAKYAVTTIVGYLIIAFGTLAALNKAGLQWSELKFVAGAFSLGLAFGMQEIIANFVCGIILLFERPVRIGDYVTIGSQSGTVKRIQIRAVTLQDLDRRETVIPNKKLITDDVTNWSLTDEVVRMTVHVGIAYGSDTALAQKTMMTVLLDNPNILKNPEPTVLFLGFGDSSLDFEIRGFMNDIRDLPRIKSQIHLAVDDAFRTHKIEIPFPQRVVHHVPAPQ